MHGKSHTTNSAFRKTERIPLQKITHIIFDHDGTLVDTTSLKPRIFQGVDELIRALAQREIPLFIWTARSKVSTVRILQELSLLSFFKDICGSDTATMKPSAAGPQYLVPEANPENVIVIGDSLGDIMGAKNYGAYPVGVNWFESQLALEKLKEAGAEEVFGRIAELKDFIFERI